MFFAGLFGWTGMICMWIAARSRPTIGKRTAIGLGLGIVSAILYAVLYWSKSDAADPLPAFPPLVLISPVWIAAMHLGQFRKLMATPEAERPARLPRPPPSESSTRRVALTLKIVLYLQVLNIIFIGATLLEEGTGWGRLLIVVFGFPFALGVLTFCVWSFVRHRPCRTWAATVFFAPAVLFAALRLSVRLLSEPTVTLACRRALPWLPVASILIFPRFLGRLTPRLLRKRAFCIVAVIVQALMLVPWVLLLRGGLAYLKETQDPTIVVFILVHTPLSILAGIIGLCSGYVALFRQRGERFIVLSITHMVFSILLLAISVPVAWFLMVIATPMG
jgi:hypothetical protein